MVRFKTGIKEFNEIIPGLPLPSAVLVQGTPGAGKAVFVSSLMDTKSQAKKIILLTNSTPDEVKNALKNFKIKFSPVFIDCYSWLSGDKAAVDSLVDLSKILFLVEDALEEGSAVFFDSLTPLILYNSEEDIERFLQQLIAVVKASSSIILFTLDSGTYSGDSENTIQSLCDGVLVLDPTTGMKLVKMRDTKVPKRVFHYAIGSKGFHFKKK